MPYYKHTLDFYPVSLNIQQLEKYELQYSRSKCFCKKNGSENWEVYQVFHKSALHGCLASKCVQTPGQSSRFPQIRNICSNLIPPLLSLNFSPSPYTFLHKLVKCSSVNPNNSVARLFCLSKPKAKPGGIKMDSSVEQRKMGT